MKKFLLAVRSHISRLEVEQSHVLLNSSFAALTLRPWAARGVNCCKLQMQVLKVSALWCNDQIFEGARLFCVEWVWLHKILLFHEIYLAGFHVIHSTDYFDFSSRLHFLKDGTLLPDSCDV